MKWVYFYNARKVFCTILRNERVESLLLALLIIFFGENFEFTVLATLLITKTVCTSFHFLSLCPNIRSNTLLLNVFNL